MIQEVKRQIHFTSYIPTRGRVKDDTKPPTVNIDCKRGRIVFGSPAIKQLNLNGKFIAFYYDSSKKIIGWRIKDKLDESQFTGKNTKWKLVKAFGRHASSGNGWWVTNVKGILDAFNGSLQQDKYNHLEIKKYVEKEGVIERGDTYYFVQLKDKYNEKGEPTTDDDDL